MLNFQLSIDKKDLPRERMIESGPEALKNYELLSILLGTGTREKSVLTISNEIMNEFNSFTNISKLNRYELMSLDGIGVGKACIIMSVFEIFKRLDKEKFSDKIKLNTPKKIYEYMKDKYKYKDRENLYVLSLNTNNELISADLVSVGTINMTVAHPREIFKFAIKNSACSIVLTHNHPSGNINPSDADINFTRSLIKVSKMVEIPLLDHVIVTDTGYYSLKSNNYM